MFEENLQKLFLDEGFSLSKTQVKQFVAFRNLLLEWNAKFNLTAITDEEGILIKHFLDSVLPLKYIDSQKESALIDVGTGAGFPGIPLKILCPDLRITLIDALNKRVVFLKEVLSKIGIDGNAVHMRAEDAGQNPLYREQFDYATARAVTHLRELSEYTLPLLRVGGKVLALKGGDVKAEVQEAAAAIGEIGGQLEEVHQYILPNGDKRSLIILNKRHPSKKKYPRNAGQIKKNPIQP